MVRKYLIHILLVIIAFLATTLLIPKVFERSGDLVISLEVKTTRKLSIQFFYAVSGDPAFSQDKSLSSSVDTPGKFRMITFTLPDRTDITGMRFDLGEDMPSDQDQDTIVLRRIYLQKGSADISLGGNLVEWFHYNNWIQSIDSDGTIVTHVQNGSYDPSILCIDTPALLDSMTTGKWQLWLSQLVLFMTLAIAIAVSIPPIERSVPMLLFVSSFVLFIVLPGISMYFFHSDAASQNEKRQLSQVPEFGFSKVFAKEFEAYFSDNFGFRNELIENGSAVKMSVFGTEVNSEKVMIGEQGWMFYNNANGADFIFKSYSHSNLLTAEELAVYVGEQIQAKTYLNSKGVKYFLGFCPQTQTIYPEYLPYFMKLQVRDTLSKADQIIDALRNSGTDFTFIDLRPALQKAKSDVRLYLKHDSHWNEYGAFVGYSSLFTQMFPETGVESLPLSSYDVEWKIQIGGDLVNMLGAGVTKWRDTIPTFTAHANVPTFVESTPQGLPDRGFITTCDECADPRTLMVFRDSYSEPLVKYLSVHFRKVIYIWWRYRQRTVDDLHPDIVIDLPVERYL